MTMPTSLAPLVRGPRRALLAATCLGIAASLGGCVGVAAPVPATGLSGTCYAGAYVCQMPGQAPVGTQCTCPGIGAPSYGVVQ